MSSEPGALRRYAAAVGAILCALVLTPLLRPFLGPLPSVLFAAAIMLSAWYGGLGPGLLAIGLSLVATPAVLPPPPGGPTADAGGALFVLITALLGWQSSAKRRARAALRVLADAGTALAASLDYETTLAAAARLPVPGLADGCVVDLLDEELLRPVAAAHTDADFEAKLRSAVRPQALARAGTDDDEFGIRLAEQVTDQARRQAFGALGVRSVLVVPLVARGRTIGTLTLLALRRWRGFRRRDLPVAEELAHRCALAIDNARLYREARDMEEALRQRAEQLVTADRHKDQFLAVLAHELRNPLGALRSALDVLRQRVPPAAPDVSSGVMARQVETLARLVDDLLDVARIAQGKVAVHRQPLDLADVLGHAVSTARSQLDARRQTLTVTLPREPLPVEGDPVRLGQVFANLLSNAARYTDPAGHVWLSAHAEPEGGAAAAPGGEVVVSVRDTGIGMEPEFLARAFDLFAQGREALERSSVGLGIGLSLVRRLVELHGGTVEAHSDGPGKGSEFTVRLPLAKHEGPRATGENGTSALPAGPSIGPGTSRRVLVVDDSADAAEAVALLLRLRGHEVRVAHDGPAALEAVQEYAPDAVLLDLALPGMDGHEVCRRLRDLPGLECALLVALTGYGEEEDRRKSREAGFDLHLVKPVDPEDLARLLNGGRA